MTDITKPAVLFVCVHNAGRSQMAAGYLRAIAGDRIDVFSAGSESDNAVNPNAVAVMAEEGIDLARAVPRILTTDAVRRADVVITMGCGDACPIFPGECYEDWQLTDPAGQSIEIVREVRDDIRGRIEELVGSLV
ncbi:arsenate reductase [Microbacterium sp. SORGH_AS 505]|uniref:arsenate reductase ArsC n=1 Tax=Microbacterium sp. SORGH_AS_0505 TaxID=3041770 RepID=UPI00277D52F2|nr:arsenate reductase ArsC [Microbacterium sp. SORGH_AS_0505]MDQ1125860.1 arsenate reductase [Microbacterium sp. SORGH_AS_0505]